MSEVDFIAILLSLVATLFAVLVALLGWMGNKVYARMTEMTQSMHNIERDLHGRISALDRRVTRVEGIVDPNSPYRRQVGESVLDRGATE